MRVKIDRYAYGGFGIGYIDSKPCFVPYTLAGEEVEVKLVKEKKDYNECILEKVINPSNIRIDPPCKYYTLCGGCDFQHTDYTDQIEIKKTILKDQLKRIGKIETHIDEIIPSENHLYYRNRLQFKFDGKNFGFYERNSNRVVDIEGCLIAKRDIDSIINRLKKFLIKYGLNPKEIHIFSNQKDEKIVKLLFDNPLDLQNIIPNMDIVWQEISEDIIGISFYGKGKRIDLGQCFLFYDIERYRFRVSMDSFFQVNIFQVGNLINQVVDILKNSGTRRLMDFYCGVGTFSIPSGFRCDSVLGIESNESAVKDAKANIKHNNLKNVRFLKGKSEKGIKYALEFKPDTVVLDPPRSGCGREFIDGISGIGSIERLVYISCNPSTLARDIDYLTKRGFGVEKVKLIDMFPQTHHIESICLLSRL